MTATPPCANASQSGHSAGEYHRRRFLAKAERILLRLMMWRHDALLEEVLNRSYNPREDDAKKENAVKKVIESSASMPVIELAVTVHGISGRSEG